MSDASELRAEIDRQVAGRQIEQVMLRNAVHSLTAASDRLTELVAANARLTAENTRLRRAAGLATAGAAELAIARLEAENGRLRAVVEAACGYTDVMDGSGTVTLGEHRRQLIAAVRAYRAATTGGES